MVRLKRLHTYQFTSIRSLLPLVLAQLLIQFQKPIVVTENALAVNGSRPLLMTDTASQLSNDSTVGTAAHRSARAVDGPFSIDENENSIHSANLFAPDYSIGRWRYVRVKRRRQLPQFTQIEFSHVVHLYLFFRARAL